MSRAARAAVRVAAHTLPRGVRERYREEWLADLEGSAEAGVRVSGIVVGALLFSATLRRDTPDLLGMPLAVAARRHARWAAALLSSSAVLAIGTYLTGGFASESGGVLAVLAVLWAVLTVTVALAGLVAAWRAAELTSPLATIAATALTAGVLGVATAAFGGPWIVGLVAALLIVVGTGAGAIAWAGSAGGPAPEPLPAGPPPRELPLVLITALVVAGTLLVALLMLFGGILVIYSLVTVPLAALGLGALYVRRARRSAHEPAPASAWVAVIVTGAALLAVVAVGGLDLLVWSPLAQAPGFTLDEIWAALAPADRVQGMTWAVGWIVFWSLASLAYVSGALALLGRRGRPTTRALVSVGLLLVGAAVFFQFVAGFPLGMDISDTLPPYRGTGAPIGAWYAMAGQLALVGALLLGVSPRPFVAARPA